MNINDFTQYEIYDAINALGVESLCGVSEIEPLESLEFVDMMEPHEIAEIVSYCERNLNKGRGDTMNKATQRPWEADMTGEYYTKAGVIRHNGVVVCRMTPSCIAPNKEETQANAELIVTAVNAHDDLVAALESFLRAPHIGSDGPGSSTIVVQEFNLKAARAALAKAKEEPFRTQESGKGIAQTQQGEQRSKSIREDTDTILNTIRCLIDAVRSCECEMSLNIGLLDQTCNPDAWNNAIAGAQKALKMVKEVTKL